MVGALVLPLHLYEDFSAPPRGSCWLQTKGWIINRWQKWAELKAKKNPFKWMQHEKNRSTHTQCRLRSHLPTSPASSWCFWNSEKRMSRGLWSPFPHRPSACSSRSPVDHITPATLPISVLWGSACLTASDKVKIDSRAKREAIPLTLAYSISFCVALVI